MVCHFPHLSGSQDVEVSGSIVIVIVSGSALELHGISSGCDHVNEAIK